MPKFARPHLSFAMLLFVCCLLAQPAVSQTTISTGSILGTVADQSGSVIPGAQVTILNKNTGQQLRLKTNSAGAYNSGPLTPGDYTVRIEAPGFATSEINVTVQVANTTSGNATLEVGSATTRIEVEAAGVQVNTEQATVQGVITQEQIEQLPINGRNFLDLAQLEPGVQIQDGAVFDPTKNGFSSISFGGRWGRTARIQVDGGDVSDENVGTTTMNIPASALQEFQVEQSTLDLSSGLTSSGAVNVSTRSGTNLYHGEAFDYGRWHNLAARVAPTDLFFRRQQFGGNVGGPIKKDKLFFFLDWERNRQDYAAPVLLSPPFESLSSSVNQPFREHEAFARMDWQATSNLKVFYRYTYNINSNVVPFIPNTFSPFRNRNHAQDHLAGFDLTTGKFTHTFRFEYLRFANEIGDASAGIYNPAPGLQLGFGGDPFCITGGVDAFCSGTNFLAPQVTQQHDLEFKYDGGTIRGKHVIRYGAEINRLLGGGFASFLALAPSVGDNMTNADLAAAATGPFPGGTSNPLNYPVDSVTLGNGVGYGSEIPRFGFPGGGQSDTRFSAYFADNWKIRPNVTLSLGVHYVRDTGRSDADLAAIPVLDQFGAGLGNRVNQPNKNFAPQVGITWDPWKNGKTAIRAGAGIYYENTVWNNVLFDRPARLEKGLFLGFTGGCGTLTFPGNVTVDANDICGQPVGKVASQIIALQHQYQAATLAAGPAANGSYIGNALADNQATGTFMFAPNFRTPYSVQFNVGVQRQVRPGTVLTVDYVRNRALHYLVYYDTNHVGAARYLDKNAASAAINAVNQFYSCPSGPSGVDCAIAAGATISAYASPASIGVTNPDGTAYLGGVDSGAATNSGFPGCNCAFPGINPNLGQNYMLQPIGNSIYNGLDVSLRQQVTNPLPGVKAGSLQISYALSRFRTQSFDQDFGGALTDWDNYNHYIGPNALDRTHQFSAGGFFDLPKGIRLNLITHADSSLPLTLTLPPGAQREATTAQIFQSDVTGDGTTGDVMPGTNVGSFGRQVTPANINNYINAYNNQYAGKLTPAGTALVNAGLFSASQLVKLGAVAPTLALAPAGQVGMGSLFTADVGISWVGRLGERVTIQPSVTFYNVTNSQNYDIGNNTLLGTLQEAGSPSPGSANSTTYHERTSRITLGSGVYGLGAPRVLEFGLKVNF
jgi:hypothetical protein